MDSPRIGFHSARSSVGGEKPRAGINPAPASFMTPRKKSAYRVRLSFILVAAMIPLAIEARTYRLFASTQ